jgi:hypothetical protein
MGLKLKSWDDLGAPIYGQGDGLVGSKVIEWACETWQKDGIRVRCRDMLSDDRRYYHRYLLKTPEIAAVIGNWIAGEAENVGDHFSDEL